MKKTDTKKMVGLALFTAIVVVLQFLGSFIRFGPFSISLVLVPIVVGAAVYGWKAGAWLGFVFGLVVIISGDAAAFLAVNALGTVATVMAKGTLAGLCAGLIYRLAEKMNTYFAVACSAIICPLVNTGIFLVGCLLFFMDTIVMWAEGAGFSGNVGGYMIAVLVGFNFIFELLVNLILSPIIVRVIKIGKKS